MVFTGSDCFAHFRNYVFLLIFSGHKYNLVLCCAFRHFLVPFFTREVDQLVYLFCKQNVKIEREFILVISRY
jgi:hypothetical protein